MTHTLPELKYEYTDLEPVIDAKTMEIHHSKHHQGYVNNLNAALEGHNDLLEKNVEDLLKDLDSVPEDIRTAVRNNGGGHYNHSLFWDVMTPNENKPSDELEMRITEAFGSLELLKDEMIKAATSQFGSGWAWLVVEDDKLSVVATPNQDNPVSQGKKPILGVDVWEHAYYLNYQNKRKEYVEKWWDLINWEQVENNLNS